MEGQRETCESIDVHLNAFSEVGTSFKHFKSSTIYPRFPVAHSIAGAVEVLAAFQNGPQLFQRVGDLATYPQASSYLNIIHLLGRAEMRG